MKYNYCFFHLLLLMVFQNFYFMLFLLFKILIIFFQLLILMKLQSLFYWILFSYLKPSQADIALTRSFNPYSTGFSSFIKRQEGGEMEKEVVSILILLDSLLLLLLIFKSVKNMCVSILILLDSLLLQPTGQKILFRGFEFQSLFYWILFFYSLFSSGMQYNLSV